MALLKTIQLMFWILLLPRAVISQTQIPANVLIYTLTLGYVHESTSTAVQALRERGASINVNFEHTEDPNVFTDEGLARYDGRLAVLYPSGKAAFQKYLNLGGNFAGIHYATGCLENDTFYEKAIGAYFDYHPPGVLNATVNVVNQSHPSTSMLPAQWKIQDEMYNFKSDPRDIGATVILSADESSYTDDGERKYDQGEPHPTAWYQERIAAVESGGTPGRSFCTSLGHSTETWHDDLFMAHVLGGIQWASLSNTMRAFNPSASVGATNLAIVPTASGFTLAFSVVVPVMVMVLLP
uniref:Putative class I glutamine amidotransferase-like protein n=1 Tax=Moniliophthora roreri TaxID=221103 RepID=A0A0W0FJ23_MONRR